VSQAVVVVGQGYVGLPLALAAAGAGHTVVGVDIDSARVEALNKAVSPVGDVPVRELRLALESRRYRADTSFDAVADADVVVICVPTPFSDEAPDLSYVEAAGREVGRRVSSGALVVLESTSYPGTTDEVLAPLLAAESGFSADELDVAFSPERIDPGNPTYGLRNTPKVIGARTRRARDRAAAFYESFVDKVVPVSSAGTAEMAKLLENTFRHINIALANEMAIMCRALDLDVWEVIDAASTKPFGFMPFRPGPGVGGHCIPVDPMYLSWKVRQHGGASRFIALARDINAGMPAYVVSRVQELLNEVGKPVKGSRILVVGVTYKPDVADLRETPAIELIAGLLRLGAEVDFVDPYVDRLEVGGRLLDRAADAVTQSARADCLVIVTPHTSVDHGDLATAASLTLDTCNAIPGRSASVHGL
jgi:UDP-N-acetyl-D-glucosamine dehydrogenase